jgi:predicted Zn-dependent protease
LFKRAINKVVLLPVLLVLSTAVYAGPTGKEIFDGVIQSTPIYDDKELANYVGRLVGEIVQVSEMSDERFTFTLLDSPDVNAFATRDNYVYVNRGLLNYVNNEAQLVSVLAHEVGHITKGHVTAMEGKASGAQVLAALAAMLSGSPEVYDAGMAYANSLIRGHGRNNELEADQAAAEYMAKLGYDPEDMIDMLATMKDMESLQKKRAASQGAPKQTYHGIFSSHPRNDSRLRNAVTRAKEEISTNERDDGAERYRHITDGLIWGENFQEKEAKPTRYSNQSLKVRFDFPDEWKHVLVDQGPAVKGEPEEKTASLYMEPQARTAQTPEEYLYNYLNSPALRDGRTIEPARLKGFTGILEGKDGSPDSRIAVVYYKMNAYIFTGEVADQAQFEEFDKLFIDAIDTFRPISSREIAGQAPKKMRYVKATEATTFDALAEHLKMSEREAEDLRLINGYYPAGEPEAGDWIKIIQQ